MNQKDDEEFIRWANWWRGYTSVETEIDRELYEQYLKEKQDIEEFED